MNANDSRPARMTSAMVSIGRPARSQAIARRTFWMSVARNGAGPSLGTRTPRSTMRPIWASVPSAGPAGRPSAAAPSASESMAAILSAARGTPGEERLGDPGPGDALVALVAALLAQVQVQPEGLEQGRQLGRLPAPDAGRPLHDHGHPAQGPLVGGEPVGPRGLLEGALDRVQLVGG